jgi:xylulokinase
MGIARVGAVSATIGTSGVVFASTDRPALDPQGRLHTFCHAIPGRWHVMGVTQAAGLSLRWYRDNFGMASPGLRGSEVQKDSEVHGSEVHGSEVHGSEVHRKDPYDVFSEEAATVPAGSEGAYWVPYLMGERTPHLDPNARAALVGLTASHTRAHVIRAIMEGVAFSLKDTFSIFEEMNIPLTSIRLGGGGARSPLWRQIQADVYAHEVEIVAAEEGAAYGAAILAGTGAREWSSVEQACDAVVRVAKKIPANAKDSATMQNAYGTYRKIYPALKQLE